MLLIFLVLVQMQCRLHITEFDLMKDAKFWKLWRNARNKGVIVGAMRCYGLVVLPTMNAINMSRNTLIKKFFDILLLDWCMSSLALFYSPRCIVVEFAGMDCSELVRSYCAFVPYIRCISTVHSTHPAKKCKHASVDILLFSYELFSLHE